ncbi:MAG: haloacid dehalogenase-like hydrolase [Rhodobacter sp.]|nr:haloacid dehalogenase-like hydrolase [Rhodobacter sp.]
MASVAGAGLVLAEEAGVGGIAFAQADPLPSWNDTAQKQAILSFVQAVTTEGSPDFVPPSERVAVFDNDGTLWVESPIYTQLAFVIDRVRALAPDHPEWASTQPFKAVLDNDLAALSAAGEKGVIELLMATHAGISTEEFDAVVTGWIATARDGRFKRPYTGLVYQPMLELLAYLRANGFETFIVSGGGVEFMRPWTEAVYGIPPQNVIGSSIRTELRMVEGKPVLMRLPQVVFIDDKAGKPVGINAHIGRRPIAAFGNSDGDYEMLEWVTKAEGRSLGMIVHHTDAAREYAYDRNSPVGRLVRGLDDAAAQGWTVIDMKADWGRVSPPSRRRGEPLRPDRKSWSFPRQSAAAGCARSCPCSRTGIRWWAPCHAAWLSAEGGSDRQVFRRAAVARGTSVSVAAGRAPPAGRGCPDALS